MPIYAPHEVRLHDVIRVSNVPVLSAQVLLTLYFLKDGVSQRLVEALYVTYAVELMWDAGLKLYRRLTLLSPCLYGFRD